MVSKAGATLLLAAASLVLAGCGGGGRRTYVLTPSGSAGIYLTISSPVALPEGFVRALKPAMTVVDKPVGRKACFYSRPVEGIRGAYAHLNGTQLHVTVSGSGSLVWVICSGHPLWYAPAGRTGFGASGVNGTTSPIGPTGPVGPTGVLGATSGNGATGEAGPTGLWGATGGGVAIGAAQRLFEPNVPWPRSIEPVAVTSAQLKALSRALGAPIYWAGDRTGYSYRLRLWRSGQFAVSYVARGSRVFMVATHPIPAAYRVLKTQAKGKALAGPGGSVYFVLPTYRSAGYGTHVLMAFPGVDYQVELFARDPTIAPKLVTDGSVRPVTG